MDTFTLIASGEILVAVIGVMLIVRELSQTKKIAENDMDRRRKDSTYQNYQQNRNQILSTHLDISQFLNRDYYDKIPLTSEEQKRIDEDQHISKQIEILLSNLERLSVGVNQNIFDEDVLFRLVGHSFHAIYSRYEPYIIQERSARFVTYLSDSEVLAKRFEKRILYQE